MSKQNKTVGLLLIGRSDLVDFPELGLYEIPVKIDTGAYTSAIHAVGIKEHAVEGKRLLTFSVAGMNQAGQPKKKFWFENFKKKKITSSNGMSEVRYVIKTPVRLFGRKIRAEFSLSNRSTMRIPVLLGRKLLKNRFLVDVNQKNLSLT